MNNIDLYKKIKTPVELLKFMNDNIKYGVYGTDKKVYNLDGTKEKEDLFEYACKNKYELSSPKKLLEHCYGHCWDQVELEREWFKSNNYEFKTFYIMFLLDYDNSYTTHTYLVYKDKEKNKYYYFENSDYKNRGIHEFNSYEEAINYQKQKHIEYNKSIGNTINNEILSTLKIYEYDEPKYGLNMKDFIDYVLNSKEVII